MEDMDKEEIKQEGEDSPHLLAEIDEFGNYDDEFGHVDQYDNMFSDEQRYDASDLQIVLNNNSTKTISYQETDDNNIHKRDLSSLSTTPFASLEDEVVDYLRESCTTSTKATDYLEKERQAIFEKKKNEIERRKGATLACTQLQQRQECHNSTAAEQQLQQDGSSTIMLQLDDQELINLGHVHNMNNDLPSRKYFTLQPTVQTLTLTPPIKEEPKPILLGSIHETDEKAMNHPIKCNNTVDRKLFKDRRLLKRFGSLTPTEKDFLSKVYGTQRLAI